MKSCRALESPIPSDLLPEADCGYLWYEPAADRNAVVVGLSTEPKRIFDGHFGLTPYSVHT